VPGVVQAAAHGSKRGAHDLWHKAVEQGAEGGSQDEGQRVGEPGGQTARGVLLTRIVERRGRRGSHGGALRRRAESVYIDKGCRGDDGRIVTSVSHCCW
jgi:hypothetical protein